MYTIALVVESSWTALTLSGIKFRGSDTKYPGFGYKNRR